ncbi:MAG: hypothetical protein KDC38_06535 [Planctomycetes bacterium]|nr:hypothetical protein [Planctomycetota bacterium]
MNPHLARISTLASIFWGVTTLLSTPASAAVFHLTNGDEIVGAYVGRIDAGIVILDADGHRRELASADLRSVDPTTPAPKAVERKATRERKRHLDNRRREAKTLVRQYGVADVEKRTEIEGQLHRYDEAELLPALDDALGGSNPRLRDFAFAQLKSFQSSGALVPLVKLALRPDGDATFRERAHSTALDRDATKTRELYEYVALSAEPPARLEALGRIGQVGSPQSTPRLLQLLTVVQLDIRAQLVRSKGLREVPVSLGRSTNLPIQLPEVELIEVMTSSRVPVEVLRRLEGATIAALQSVTGVDRGSDAQAWQAWWESYQIESKQRVEDPPG